jgi:DNA-binding NtrC family response regulator
MLKRKTILVVEDEPQLRFFAVKILEMAGHLVLSAENAQETMGIWDRVGGAFDLLITDILMPGLNGIELAQELRKSRPDLKIIFVTENADIGDEVSALSGAKIIFKPYTIEAFRETVRRMFEAEQ